MSQFTVRLAAVVARTHNALRTNPQFLTAKSDAELSLVIRATAASLAKLSRDGVAAEVRLPKAKLTSMLWTLYKAAKAEARKRAECDAEQARIEALVAPFLLDAEPDLSGAELGATREYAETVAFERAEFWASPCGICGAPRDNCYC